MTTPRWTIYCHIHVNSGRRYIGLTKKTMMFRWNQHLRNAKYKTGRGCVYFWNAIRKYGKDAFSHEILEICDTIDVANAAEEKWILHFNSRDPLFGFNTIKGGSHTPHSIKNPWDRPEYREKQLDKLPVMLGRLHSPEARAKSKASLNTPESKAKRSALTKLSLSKPETIVRREAMRANQDYGLRISTTLKNSLSDEEVRVQLSSRTRQLHSDPDYKQKVSNGIRSAYADSTVKERHRLAVKQAQNQPELLVVRRAYRATNATKAKISAASTGRFHTPSSIEEQRRLYLERSSKCKFCDDNIEGKRSCIKGRVACLSCYDMHRNERATFLRSDGSFIGS